MIIRKNIATSEEGFIFNPTNGDSFSKNSIGSDIILLLKKNMDVNEVVETICNKYDVDKSLLERDLEDFMQQLADFGILDKTNSDDEQR